MQWPQCSCYQGGKCNVLQPTCESRWETPHLGKVEQFRRKGKPSWSNGSRAWLFYGLVCISTLSSLLLLACFEFPCPPACVFSPDLLIRQKVVSQRAPRCHMKSEREGAWIVIHLAHCSTLDRHQNWSKMWFGSLELPVATVLPPHWWVFGSAGTL